MTRISRRAFLATYGMAPVAGALLARRWSNATVSAREVIRERYFPNVVLRTHENKRVRFYDDLIKNKIVAINFMYAHCEGVCPRITSNLEKRSEEHTSELQSRGHLVCRLLLEKKKTVIK